MSWTSLVVQWLRLCLSTAGGHRFDPWLGKFLMPCGAAKKKKKKYKRVNPPAPISNPEQTHRIVAIFELVFS